MSAFKRRIAIATSAIALVPAALGWVLAQDPKPLPAPQPAPEAMPAFRMPQANPDANQPFASPVVPAPLAMPTAGTPQNLAPSASNRPADAAAQKSPVSYSPQEVQERIRSIAQKLKPDEQSVLVDAIFVELPVGFIAASGLTDDRPGKKDKASMLATCLSPRELRLLEALIRATPERHVVSRPWLAVPDGKTGFFELGIQIKFVSMNSGTGPVTPPNPAGIRISPYDAISMRVTPTIGTNDLVHLRIQPQIARIEGTDDGAKPSPVAPQATNIRPSPAIPTGSLGVVSPTMSVETTETSVLIPSGGTVALGKRMETAASEVELLWLLTPHVVRGK